MRSLWKKSFFLVFLFSTASTAFAQTPENHHEAELHFIVEGLSGSTTEDGSASRKNTVSPRVLHQELSAAFATLGGEFATDLHPFREDGSIQFKISGPLKKIRALAKLLSKLIGSTPSLKEIVADEKGCQTLIEKPLIL